MHPVIPGTILGAGGITVNKKLPCVAYILGEDTANNSIDNILGDSKYHEERV